MLLKTKSTCYAYTDSINDKPVCPTDAVSVCSRGELTLGGATIFMSPLSPATNNFVSSTTPHHHSVHREEGRPQNHRVCPGTTIASV